MIAPYAAVPDVGPPEAVWIGPHRRHRGYVPRRLAAHAIGQDNQAAPAKANVQSRVLLALSGAEHLH